MPRRSQGGFSEALTRRHPRDESRLLVAMLAFAPRVQVAIQRPRLCGIDVVQTTT